MKRPVVPALAAIVLALGLWAGFRDAREAAAQSGAPPQQQRPGPDALRAVAAPVDSFGAERDSLAKVVLAEIAGKEKVAAESVFKNIKILKGVPAERIPRIMANGWGRALGVRCRHCHVQDHWDVDDKPQKQITRDMAAMNRTINVELLGNIKNLGAKRDTSDHARVTCTTCHRGQVRPALNL